MLDVRLKAKLFRLIATHANEKDNAKRKSPKRVPFFASEIHKHSISIAALTVHAKMSLLYTFQRSMQADRNINLW